MDNDCIRQFIAQIKERVEETDLEASKNNCFREEQYQGDGNRRQSCPFMIAGTTETIYQHKQGDGRERHRTAGEIYKFRKNILNSRKLRPGDQHVDDRYGDANDKMGAFF